jgi:hypothetical protein
MKKIIGIVIGLSMAFYCLAQTPGGFSYQAVLRTSIGQVLGSQTAQLRVTLVSSNGLTTHYQEVHNVTSTAQGLINVIIGNGTDKIGDLSSVPWGNDQITMKTEIKVNPATTFTLLGTQPLQAVPYALYANNTKEVTSSTTAGDEDPIFVVRNRLGQIVFAVYQEGVRVFVDDGTTPTKGTKGGFAVGGLSGSKADGAEYLRITPDSARIWVNQGTKGAKGGFAVGGLSGTKDAIEFLNLTPNNYFIGHNVAPFITSGLRNSVIGYNAGYFLQTGNDNVFIGNKAGYNTRGNENIFIGNEAGYKTTTPVRNVFIGHEAGHENEIGQYNLYVGNMAGRNGTGYYNTILGGLAARTNDFGDGNVVIGYVAGRDMKSSNNVFIGQGAGYNNTSTGDGSNVFIGYYAGETLSSSDYRLAIASNRSKPILIYGEFDNQRVAINGTTTNNLNFYVNGTAGGSSAWSSTSDKRLKKNITTIDNPLSKVLKLRGVSYEWLDEAKPGKQIGFIAQETLEVLPEVVTGTEQTTYSMQYAPITALLVEAIKEQQKVIDELRTKNSKLEDKVKEIDNLKAELEAIKKLLTK